MKTNKTISEIESRADFSYIRYSQCWEDTSVVVEALDVKQGDICLSIASAGDNSLSLLTKNPQKVIALDLNKSQLALVELKSTAIKYLTRDESLQLLGYKNCTNRLELLDRISCFLSPQTAKYFSNNLELIERGVSKVGKFENYFKYFRTLVLPLVHRKSTVEELVAPKSKEERIRFYHEKWNTTLWRLLFKVFFSNQIMGLLGRDKEFFKYTNNSLPEFLEGSVYNALVEQDPSKNPYLHWILFGSYRDVLPYWLEKKNYETIKKNIDRLELRVQSLEEFVKDSESESIDCWNLSDIFEYMSHENYVNLLRKISTKSNRGARLAYWNMLVPRFVETSNDLNIECKPNLSKRLYQSNKTFFYTRFNLEVVGSC